MTYMSIYVKSNECKNCTNANTEKTNAVTMMTVMTAILPPIIADMMAISNKERIARVIIAGIILGSTLFN